VGTLGIEGLEDEVVVGRGAFGVVYRAWQPSLHREVAVKILPGAFDESAQRRFERECAAVGSLSDEPGILTIHAVGRTADGSPYLVMPFMAEGSLADRLHAGGLPPDEVVRHGTTLGRALAAAHRGGVLHLDLKPANVLLDARGGAHLADFGIARFLDGEQTGHTATVGGTPGYTAPEIFDGSQPTTACDVYGLGATLHALAGGRPPFSLSEAGGLTKLLRQITDDPPPDLRPAGVPDGLWDVIETAMAKDPADRYPSMDAMVAALEAVAGRLEHPGDPPGAGPAVTPRPGPDPFGGSPAERDELTMDEASLAAAAGRRRRTAPRPKTPPGGDDGPTTGPTAGPSTGSPGSAPARTRLMIVAGAGLAVLVVGAIALLAWPDPGPAGDETATADAGGDEAAEAPAADDDAPGQDEGATPDADEPDVGVGSVADESEGGVETDGIEGWSDDFAGEALDIARWQAGTIEGVEGDVRLGDGYLRLLVDEADQGAVYLQTTCLFTGDYDVEASFRLEQWAANSGARFGMLVGSHDGQLDGGAVLRLSEASESQQPGEHYATHIADQVTFDPTDDASGRLRLTRSGDVLTGYRWAADEQRWMAIDTRAALPGQDEPRDHTLRLQAWGPVDSPVVVAVDDVVMTSGACV
jgi:hypothetical protein